MVRDLFFCRPGFLPNRGPSPTHVYSSLVRGGPHRSWGVSPSTPVPISVFRRTSSVPDSPQNFSFSLDLSVFTQPPLREHRFCSDKPDHSSILQISVSRCIPFSLSWNLWSYVHPNGTVVTPRCLSRPTIVYYCETHWDSSELRRGPESTDTHDLIWAPSVSPDESPSLNPSPGRRRLVPLGLHTPVRVSSQGRKSRGEVS